MYSSPEFLCNELYHRNGLMELGILTSTIIIGAALARLEIGS